MDIRVQINHPGTDEIIYANLPTVPREGDIISIDGLGTRTVSYVEWDVIGMAGSIRNGTVEVNLTAE